MKTPISDTFFIGYSVDKPAHKRASITDWNGALLGEIELRRAKRDGFNGSVWNWMARRTDKRFACGNGITSLTEARHLAIKAIREELP